MDREDVRAEEPDPGSITRRLEPATRENPRATTSNVPSLQVTPLATSDPASAAVLAPPRRISRGSRPIEPINRFPLSDHSRAFLKTFYPGVSVNEWNDWKWQIRNRVRRLDVLERMLDLTDDERASVIQRTGNLPIAITPYYLSLLSPTDPLQSLRRTHIPVGGEFVQGIGEDPDPLHEDHDTAVPGLVHRYPDRVLFLTTGFCSTYCRYCTRSRMVGETNGEYSFSTSQWEKAAQYIEAHPEIRD